MAHDNTRDSSRELRWRVCPVNRVGGGRGVMPSGSDARLLRKGLWTKRGDHLRGSPSWAEGRLVASASELGRESGNGRAY